MSRLVPVLPDRRGSRELDVIFVHGLGGDFADTWSFDEFDTYWPEWIAANNPNYFVWSYSYPASPTNWKGHTTPIVDRAFSLHSDMLAEECGAVPIVFICHSLGGLVVKQLLRNTKELTSEEMPPDPILKNTAGIVFFGTPHQGADHAKLLSAFSLLTRTTVTIEELENDDRRLSELNMWFVNHFGALGCETLVFQETKPTKLLGASLGMIVDATSSNPGIPNVLPIPLDEDHITLCKFPDQNHPTFKRVLQLLRKVITRASKMQTTVAADIAIDIGVSNQYPLLNFAWQITADSSRTASYKLTRSNGRIRIASHMPYIEDFREGRELSPISYVWSPFRWLFPTLEVKIVNNSDKMISITELVFNVKSSRPRNETLLVIRDTNYEPGCLIIVNEGSAPARAVELAFDVFPFGEATPDGGPYEFDVTVGDIITESATIVLSDEDVTRLANRDARIAASVKEYKLVEIAGQMRWTADDGKFNRIRFSAAIFCGPRSYGLFTPPSGHYSIMLKGWGESYFESVHLSQDIAPGAADRFQVVVGAPCWSDHEIELTIRGIPRVNLELDNLQLEIFIPRSQTHRTHIIEAMKPAVNDQK